MTYQSKDGHLLTPRNSPLGIFWDKGGKIEVIEPMISPSVAKIPLELWHQMLGFFLWSQAEFKGEAQVSGFYNHDARTWLFEPLPQHSIGMTTKELDGPEREAILDQLRSHGYGEITFTGHHHCTAGAFQSGTDQDDEFKKKGSGFHITIGHIDKPVFDLDCRAKMCAVGKFDPETGKLLSKGCSGTGKFNIWDLVALPIEIEDFSDVLKKGLAEHYLLRTGRYEFPEHWKGRVSKPVYQQASNLVAGGKWIQRGDRMQFIEDEPGNDKKLMQGRREALDAARFLYDCEEIHSGRSVDNEEATAFMEAAYRNTLDPDYTPGCFDKWIDGLLFDEMEQFVNPERWTMEQILTELRSLKNPVARYVRLLTELQQDEFLHNWIEGVRFDVVESQREEAALEVDEQINRFVGKQDEFDAADGEDVEVWGYEGR